MTNPTRVPRWAHSPDPNYDAPGKDWDNEPRAVDPSDGVAQVGHVPLTQPNPQHQNWYRQQVQAWIEFFAPMTIENWNPAALITNCTAIEACYSPRSKDGKGLCLTIDGGTQNQIWRSADGILWELDTDLDTLTTSAVLRCIAASGDADLVVCVGGPTDDVFRRVSGTWTKHTALTNHTINAICHQPGGDFIAFGASGGDVRPLTSTDGQVWNLGGDMTGDDTGRTGGFVAASPTIVVGFAQTAGDFWTSPDGSDPWTDHNDPFDGNVVKGVVYDPDSALFWALTYHVGDDLCNLWQSGDGVSWSVVHEEFGSGVTPIVNTFCVLGAVFAFAFDEKRIAFCVEPVNGDQEWYTIQAPQPGSGEAPAEAQWMISGGGRFWWGATSVTTSSSGHVAGSIRLGKNALTI